MGEGDKREKDNRSYFYFAWPFAIEPREDAAPSEEDLCEREGLEKLRRYGRRKKHVTHVFDPLRYERELESLGWKRLGTADTPTIKNKSEHEKCCKEEEEPTPRAIPNSHSFVDRYAVWQYLSNDGRQVFKDLNPNRAGDEGAADGDYFCRIYLLDIVPEMSTYVICVGSKKYELTVDEVDLHVYSFGCGVVWLRMHGCYTSSKDTKAIAEYGRRITLPFVPDWTTDGFILCADSIVVTLASTGKRKSLGFDARACLKRLAENPSAGYELPDSCAFFEPILGMEQYELKPLNDDRMFVMELVRNDEVSNQFKALPLQFKGRPWDDDLALQKSLYEYVYVDKDGDCSCQDYGLRKQLLDEAVMPWWAGYGTIHASTGYSFVCITGETVDINDNTVRPFLNEYIYLCSLVLAQRMGIAQYSLRAGDIARKAGQRDSDSYHEALSKLQGEFVRFENQALVSEVSNQQQGIAVYQLLRKQLMVDEEQAELNEQLSELYEVVNTGVGDLLARAGVALAVIAIMADIIKDFLEATFGKDGEFQLILLFSLLVLIGIVIVVSGCLYAYLQKRSN